MKTRIVIVLSCVILIKLTEAQVIRVSRLQAPPPGPMPSSTPPPPPPQQTTPPPPPATPPPQSSAPSPSFDRTPKCYPETAKAYFLPAPPSSPKVTVLDHNVKDLPSAIKSNIKEMSSSTLAANMLANRPSFTPPPSSAAVLPDLIDEIPSVVQEKFGRVVESDVKVCDACASLISKLPIFKFDQELLDGFLVGLGI